jgi:hypothetical protein
VDEDDGAVLGEDDVGLAWEGAVFGAVDGEAEAEAVEEGTDGELGLGVARADAGHDLGAFFGGEDVGHGRGRARGGRENFERSTLNFELSTKRRKVRRR